VLGRRLRVERSAVYNIAASGGAAQRPAGPPVTGVNHVGVTVSDLDAAVAWYQDVLGFSLFGSPGTVTRNGPGGEFMADVLGDGFGKVRYAVLTGEGNGVGLEIFEFVQPPPERPEDPFPYWRVGYRHLSLTTPDPAALAAYVAATGGRQRSRVWEFQPGCFFVYCEDPFGNILEFNSRSFERFHANRE